MKRSLLDKLIEWKKRPDRKPMILRGARQVGKTWLIKEFARNHYDNLAYFNFDHDEALTEYFHQTKDPKRILEQLRFVSGPINPGATLIFFDEIQECPDALNALKYFYEEMPEFHLIAAGSLLGIRLSHVSFPVGKVQFLNLKPMSFYEFLLADGSDQLADYIKTIDRIETVPLLITDQLSEKLKAYQVIGGMPEAVKSWCENRDIYQVHEIQDAILYAYDNDFSKHTEAEQANKISYVWNSIPSQLARENRKFIYQTVRPGARAREYEGALQWLVNADLLYKIYDITKPALPMKAYDNLSAFKVYMADIGLLSRMTGLAPSIVIEKNRIFTEYKGALAENYILDILMNTEEITPRYLTFDRYEIDFMLQIYNTLIPVEVKASTSRHKDSLTKFNEKYGSALCVRFSMNNLSLDGNILNIPLYLAEDYRRFILTVT